MPALREPFAYEQKASYAKAQLLENKPINSRQKRTKREPPGKPWALQVRASLQDQRRIEVRGAETAIFPDFVAFQFGYPVKAQVVFIVP
jgi:hypothetical protein